MLSRISAKRQAFLEAGSTLSVADHVADVDVDVDVGVDGGGLEVVGVAKGPPFGRSLAIDSLLHVDQVLCSMMPP